MSTLAAIVLGLLIGWVIEWIIDWVYWRRRSAEALKQENLLREQLKASEARGADLEHQIAIQKVNLASLQEKLSCAEADLSAAKAELELKVGAPAVQVASAEVPPVEIPAEPPAPVRSVPLVRDDLEVIKGIGPVLAAKLNQFGIYTFADLAALTPERLRELFGDMLSRLANEETIIEQAKQLAADQSRGG